MSELLNQFALYWIIIQLFYYWSSLEHCLMISIFNWKGPCKRYECHSFRFWGRSRWKIWFWNLYWTMVRSLFWCRVWLLLFSGHAKSSKCTFYLFFLLNSCLRHWRFVLFKFYFFLTYTIEMRPTLCVFLWTLQLVAHIIAWCKI